MQALDRTGTRTLRQRLSVDSTMYSLSGSSYILPEAGLMLNRAIESEVILHSWEVVEFLGFSASSKMKDKRSTKLTCMFDLWKSGVEFVGISVLVSWY